MAAAEVKITDLRACKARLERVRRPLMRTSQHKRNELHGQVSNLKTALWLAEADAAALRSHREMASAERGPDEGGRWRSLCPEPD